MARPTPTGTRLHHACVALALCLWAIAAIGLTTTDATGYTRYDTIGIAALAVSAAAAATAHHHA